MSSLLHSISNTIIIVETVFDPSGVVEPLFVTMLCGAIITTTILTYNSANLIALFDKTLLKMSDREL
jgi:Flp pilus assembly protein protease CpaA